MKGSEAAFFPKGFMDYYKQNVNITSDYSKILFNKSVKRRESY